MPSADNVLRLRLVDVHRLNQIVACGPDVADVDDAARVELTLHADIPLLNPGRVGTGRSWQSGSAPRRVVGVVPAAGFES